MKALTPSVGAVAIALAAGSSVPPAVDAQVRGRASTTITVHAGRTTGSAPTHLLGVNHHYKRNGFSIWDTATDAPFPAVVSAAKRAAIDSVRFPGGTVGSLYDWKRGIGDTRACQVSGEIDEKGGVSAVSGLAFGSDEFMTFVSSIGALPLIMVPFVNDTAASAADWVEYLNSPADASGNPSGGVDWAEVRAANGHPAPYGVQRFEIGNELSHASHRYWMSRDTKRAVRQYAFGDDVTIGGERLGKDCRHPAAGVRSDGSANQVFETLYHPLVAASVTTTVAGEVWQRVADLSSRGPNDKVFTVSPDSGTVTFGDGTHGAVPPTGAVVGASYRIVHDGFFQFARAMRAVDPGIKVCSAWGTPDFARAAGSRSYDCLTAHPITSFQAKDGGWSGPLEGHDRFMVAADKRANNIKALLASLPARAPLWLTEFSTIRGDNTGYPHWQTSASHAVYMASLYGQFMKLHIPWGMGDDLLWSTDRAVIGPYPDFTYTAVAVTREALTPMFNAGGKVLSSRVSGNPLRNPPLVSQDYRALKVTAIRAPDGALFVMVVNRLPGQSVTAGVQWDGFSSNGTASMRQAHSSSFSGWNEPGQEPAVKLSVRDLSIGSRGFTGTFPPTSTTVFRIPSA